MKRTAASLGLALLAFAWVPPTAGDDTDAGASATSEAARLMTQVQADYAALTSFERELETVMAVTIGQREINQVTLASERVEPPARYRSEMTLNQMTFVAVSDGATTWTYNPTVNQYTEGAATLPDESSFAKMTITERNLDEATAGATLSGEETVQIGDASFSCRIVELDPAVLPDGGQAVPGAGRGSTIDRVRMWLSEDVPFILKIETHVSGIPTRMGEATSVITNTLRAHRANPALGDDVFTFVPPEGARLVEQFTNGRPRPGEKFLGKPAPDFTGATLDGALVSLSSQKGKVVLLDFWATWCGPCRKEMPHIQKLHDEYGDRLRILAISSEKRPTIERYIQQNKFTFTTVHDGDRSITGSYGVTGLPTLVIVDAEGNVADFLVGLRTEAQLLDALVAAGL